MKRTIGVCYYPEHWPEEVWADDARRMAECGITWVRIGEFAWSRIEPAPGEFTLDWLDRAIEVLGAAGLKVVLGTPTATPPRWMLDRFPDMLPVGEDGRVRGFGARRHYCFSHDGYREECRGIVKMLARRYGQNANIAAWQTDNEYACHGTTHSYSASAEAAFRVWLKARYGTVQELNEAWGNVFWSMEYASFDQIKLPNLTVTQPNPAHDLAFRRFSSDQVVRFNKVQVDEIRAESAAPIIHNFMGRITTFDHYRLGADLDIASWDSYPLGFLLDRVEATPAEQERLLRQGDPDFQAFHHDLFRAAGRGRWWVMEQQPGPVNWAPWNPAPRAGMVRLWAWEAFAHGAECVSFFRWRQAPFAQEQMHAGLLRPDSAPSPALNEARQTAEDLKELPEVGTARARVALIFDYASEFAWKALPQGEDFDYFQLCFAVYRALRRFGLSIDIIAPEASVDGYDLVLAPGLLVIPEKLKAAAGPRVVFGPRAGLKTEELSIALPLGPNLPGLDFRVTHVESLPPFAPTPLKGGGAFERWREAVEWNGADPHLTLENGSPALVGDATRLYLCGWPDAAAMERVLRIAVEGLDIPLASLPQDVRCRDTETHRFWFNYGNEPAQIDGQSLAPAEVRWKEH